MNQPTQSLQNPTTSDLLPLEIATAITAGGERMVMCVMRLASLGQSPRVILEQAHVRVNGGLPNFALPTGAARPLTINAYSFVRDRQQYHGTYDLSDARADELARLLLHEPEAGAAEVTRVVTEKLRAAGSTRPVVVTLLHPPAAAAGNGPPPVGAGDGGLRALKQRVAANSGLCGQYNFVAVDTGRIHGERFLADLGGGLAAVGQSMGVATSAARLMRLFGRHDPGLAPYARCVAGDRFVGPNGIPAAVWDGRLGPFEAPPAAPNVESRRTTVGSAAGSPRDRSA